MKTYRLNRLFNAASGHCAGFAFDHPPVPHKLETDEQVQVVATASADALELTIGQADALQRIRGKQKPALILRADMTNLHHVDHGTPFNRIVGNAAEQAVRLDAAAVIASVLVVPAHAGLAEQCLENILKLKSECDRWCLPLIIEARRFRPSGQAGSLEIDGDLTVVLPLIRQCVELGADILQADSTGDSRFFHRIVEIAGCIPVLVRPNIVVRDDELLAVTGKLLEQGAAGFTYGHEILRHPNSIGLMRSLIAIVHQNVDCRRVSQL